MANYTEANVADILNRAYPIGSYYHSDSDVDPATLFGGKWEKVTGGFLKASGKTGTSGSSTVTLSNVPAHSHSVQSHSHSGQSHSHSSGSTTHSHTIGSWTHTHAIGSKTHTHSVSYTRQGAAASGVSWSGSGQFYATGSMSGTTISSNTNTGNSSGTVSSSSWSCTNESASGNTSSETSSVSSTSPTVSTVGSGSPIDIMPPYRSCYVWKRVS